MLFCVTCKGKHNGTVLQIKEQCTKQLLQKYILPIQNVQETLPVK